MPNKIYYGKRLQPERATVSDIEVYSVDSEGRHRLDPAPSLKLRNHSPTGFNWGYGGSGPAQLALAILLDATGDEDVAQEHYQQFKFKYVAGWGDSWSITTAIIEEWLKEGGLGYGGH